MHQFYKAVLLVFLFFSFLFSQTDSLNIYWQKNPESNMSHYLVYRGINSDSELTEYTSIDHPLSHFADQSGIAPGNTYSYALVAVNTENNRSEFSDTVSVSLPKIIWARNTIEPGKILKLPLADVVWDGDHQLDELKISVSDVQNGLVQLNDSSLSLLASNDANQGSMSFQMTVLDPDSFWDHRTINLNVTNTPDRFFLSQNYPNPFNPWTNIEYFLAEDADIKLRIYNELGQVVKTLFAGYKTAGTVGVKWYGRDDSGKSLASGIYFCRMNVGNDHQTIKIVYLR